MANFHPATPPGSSRRPAGMRSGKTDITKQVLDEAEQHRLRLSGRRHGCYTFVCFVLLLGWVVTFAGLASATNRWGWWGLLELTVPILPTLLRYKIADAIFNFTVRNARRTDDVEEDDVEDGEQP